MTFEQNNERLKNIISKLEDNSTTLEEATKLYEEGVLLSKNCLEQLKVTEGKLLEIKEIIDDMEEE